MAYTQRQNSYRKQKITDLFLIRSAGDPARRTAEKNRTTIWVDLFVSYLCLLLLDS